jgi:hypothetical protein
MGLSVLGALITLALSLLAQSPQALKRIGLGGSSLEQRARTFTTYAFALLILAFGFFLAGVPIGAGGQTTAQTTGQPTLPPTAESESMAAGTEIPDPEIAAPPLTPETGAFGGPPPDASVTAGQPITPASTISVSTSLPGSTTPANTPVATAEPTGTEEPTATPRPTLTPTPTNTPFPTLTPTPITRPTAVVDIGGGNVWIYRSPGGQNLLILSSGDIVILLNGRANQGGILWQEIMTVTGVTGWIQEEYLVYEE